MHICPRCETTLSQSEVSQEYKDVKDISVTAKFELVDPSSPEGFEGQANQKTFVLAWTTTPWTLPGNVALAMGKDLNYVKVKFEDNFYIVVKNNLENIFEGKTYEIVGEVEAKDFEGKKYKPLFDYYLNKDLKNKENLYTIQLADFVTDGDGTGIVHIAPAFGEDDMNLGLEKNLPFIQHVGFDGRFTDDVVDFAGMEVKPKDDPTKTDVEVLKFLAEKNLIFSKQKFEHSYPHCWRCDSPLLNYTTSSWFVNVTKIKDQMLKNAQKINWTPEHIKNGRFGNWLEGARDWSISRQRFWGSVIPIWKCDKCGEIKVVGSIAELKELSGVEVEDLHKHVVDKITFECDKCAKDDTSTPLSDRGVMKRIPDVLDCWFESGSMPYAQIHYPFENQEKFKNNFPAEFIAEGVDQTRCWFYYLLVLSTALFDEVPFKNAIASGIVLAEDGKKMSKKLKNYPDPMDLFEKYGVDAVRFYLAGSPLMKADTLNFSEKEVDEVVKKLILILSNTLTFYQMYAKDNAVAEFDFSKLENVLDKWIVAQLQVLLKNISEGYDNYDLNRVSRPLTDFVNDLSTWYLRRSRDRFKSDDETDKAQALMTMKFVLLELSKLMAPVMPFMADSIYQEIGGSKESVHLEAWSEVNEDWLDENLIEEMINVREICSLGLNKRVEEKISVRQILAKAIIKFPKLEKLADNLVELIKDELNVEDLEFAPQELKTVELDTVLTPELKQQGLERELIRQINSLRKNSQLTIEDRIRIYFQADENVALALNKILNNVLADEAINEKKETEFTKNIIVDDQEIWFAIEKK